MNLSTAILRVFTDEICKIAYAPPPKVPGMGRLGSLSSLVAKPSHAQAGNLAKLQKSISTPTTGSARSGINHASLKAVGTTGSLALPPPPSV